MHRGLKSVFLALTGGTLVMCSSLGLAQNPQVTVFVYNDARIPEDILYRAERQAAKTFQQAGVAALWLNCSAFGKPSCDGLDRPDHLVLRITPNVISSISDSAFGIAFVGDDETGRNADVFWKRVQQIQQTAKVDVSLILGSVMAHEMGHLLLGSRSHAVSGLMRARWQPDELRLIRMGALQFLPEQGQRMRTKLERTLERSERRATGQ